MFASWLGKMSIIHISGSFEYSQTADVTNYMINKGFSILETNHSHPGNTPGGRSPSGFDTQGNPTGRKDTDRGSADYIKTKNGSPAIHLMYHSHSVKTYQYNSKRYVEKK